MTLELSTGRVSSGSASGVVPTFTMTGSGSTANAPAGASAFIKILGNAPGGGGSSGRIIRLFEGFLIKLFNGRVHIYGTN
jgi:hypothetical protein